MENISMESLLKSLRDAYTKSDYETVGDLLLKHKDAFSEGEFHYNLGTVHAKKGDFAVGRYHLEKAISKGYDSVAAKHNLKNVQDTLRVHDINSSKDVDDVILATGLSFGTEQYVFLSLLILLVSLWSFVKGFFGKKAFLVLVLISFIPMGTKVFWLDKFSIGIAFQDTEVYEGPSGIFEKTGTLPNGAKIIIDNETEGWFFVKRPVDYVGWIKAKNIGILK